MTDIVSKSDEKNSGNITSENQYCDNNIKKDYQRKWRLRNKDKIASYKLKHRKKEIQYNRWYNLTHKSEYKKYCEVHREEIRQYRKVYRREKIRTDLSFKIAARLRTRLYNAIKQNGKIGSAVCDLGCSIEDFKVYIASKFIDDMSWNNYGRWHLDHVTPLSSFNLNDRQQFLVACHYTNYQPLWAIDNLRKNKTFP